MFVLIVLLAAAVIGLIILGVLAFGVFGQLRRLRRALEQARGDIEPRLAALAPPAGTGKHRDPD